MIISSGYTISPTEVEQVLLRHPAVVECCVVGQSDDRGGTLISAHIELQAGVDASDALSVQLQLYVKNWIAPYKCPSKITYHAGDLPRNALGKIRRGALRCYRNNPGSAA